jgi:hypothetical protein
MSAWAGEVSPGAGRTVTLDLRRMPCMKPIATPGALPHTVWRRDIGIDILTMAMFIDHSREGD